MKTILDIIVFIKDMRNDDYVIRENIERNQEYIRMLKIHILNSRTESALEFMFDSNGDEDIEYAKIMINDEVIYEAHGTVAMLLIDVLYQNIKINRAIDSLMDSNLIHIDNALEFVTVIYMLSEHLKA